jgi:hypothetical protein
MDHAFVAKVSATINAPKVRVWNAFLNPATSVPFPASLMRPRTTLLERSEETL